MRLGAYILTGDPTWLASSLARYYDLLDELVVLVPDGHRSWAGHLLPVDECLKAVGAVDRRGIARIVRGTWTDPADVLRAENAQRTAGLRELANCDWILQLDNDEVLPEPSALVEAIKRADELGLPAVEWPMRCVYRHLGRARYLEVVGSRGQNHFEYPGPIAVRPDVQLIDCRRADGPFLRLLVTGDSTSLQVVAPPAPGESRAVGLKPEEAVLHNSWGRQPGVIRSKMRSSSHRFGARGAWYFTAIWLPAPLTWRWLRDLHPFARGLWPRLAPMTVSDELLLERDR